MPEYCVELPFNKQVKSFVWIRSNKQQILHECDKILCLNCGYLGHPSGKCLKTNTQIKAPPTKEKEDLQQKPQDYNIQEDQVKAIQNDQHILAVEDLATSEDWKLVSFKKGTKKKLQAKNLPQ